MTQYAMLAGYLPFDDDPANPEGDNINLLYKYIVSTPLTFPEYVTPHSRDLLRRILVPDPRRRADLFEVARHSWLSEYSHLVGFIGSSTKSDRDIAKSAMRQNEEPVLGRSASVREPATRSPVVPSVQRLANANADETSSRTSDTKRRTVQVEYVAPMNTNQAAQTTTIAGPGRTRARADSQGPVEVSPYASRSPQVPRKEVQTQSMQAAAVKPYQARVDDSAPTAQQISGTSGSRPNTRGNLPSRGNSYSQPSAATPTTEFAQGRFSQPKASSPGYMMTAPVPPSPVTPQTPFDRPGSHQAFNQFPAKNTQMPHSGGHKRSSTLGSITDRVLGRSNSRRKAQQSQDDGMPPPQVEKKNRKYPPVSMQNVMPATPAGEDAAPRRSTESRRSSFQFLRKNSEVAPNGEAQTKRSSRRFSFLPSNFSIGNLTGRKDSVQYEREQEQEQEQQPNKRASVQRAGRPASKGMPWGRGASRSPSQSTMQSNNPYQDERTVSRRSNKLEKPLPAGMQRKQFRDDGYGGNLLDPDDDNQAQGRIQSPQQHGQSLTPNSRADPVERFYTPAQDFDQLIAKNTANDAYPQQQRYNARMDDGYGSTTNTGEPLNQGLSNAQSIRPQQRRFGDAYERGHEGSSSGARRVMDFFRRRGKERGAKE